MKKLATIFLLFTALFLFGLSCSCEDEQPCVEKIKADCACYEIYQPVCGCNGITYSNDCVAECSGINDYTNGACE